MKIIWIDGTYGVGKTTTSCILKNKLSESKILDSDEYYRIFSVENPYAVAFGGALPQNNNKFIHYFRNVIEKEICNGAAFLIIAMAVTFDESKKELLDYFANKGMDIKHFILQASDEILQYRVVNDEQRDHNLAMQRHEWNRKFLREHYPEAIRIDTDNMTPDEVAESIVIRLK